VHIGGGHRRLVGVDALRGVAALLVVLLHAPEVEGPLSLLRPLQAVGWSGVGLFLVLSGFSIHFRYAERGGHGPFSQSVFWKRRFWRLYPTYLAAVVLGIAVMIVLTGSGPGSEPWRFTENGSSPLVIGLVAQLLLVTSNLVITPYVGVAWSMALEIQMYAVYSLIVTRMRAIGIVRLVWIALGISLAWRLGAELFATSVPMGQFKPDGSSSELSRFFYMQLPARWFEWMLGVLAAEAYFGNVIIWRPLRRIAIPIVAFLMVGLLFRYQVGLTSINGNPFYVSDVLLDQLVGIAAFGVLLWSVGLSDLVPGRRAYRVLTPLAFVGVFSYSLYLVHGSMIGIVERVLPASVPNFLLLLTCVFASLAGGYAFFLLIEKRFLRPGPERKAIHPEDEGPASPFDPEARRT
jgi:peptidoglycan/LPS O-acetylase OafA/YrhL